MLVEGSWSCTLGILQDAKQKPGSLGEGMGGGLGDGGGCGVVGGGWDLQGAAAFCHTLGSDSAACSNPQAYAKHVSPRERVPSKFLLVAFETPNPKMLNLQDTKVAAVGNQRVALKPALLAKCRGQSLRLHGLRPIEGRPCLGYCGSLGCSGGKARSFSSFLGSQLPIQTNLRASGGETFFRTRLELTCAYISEPSSDPPLKV